MQKTCTISVFIEVYGFVGIKALEELVAFLDGGRDGESNRSFGCGLLSYLAPLSEEELGKQNQNDFPLLLADKWGITHDINPDDVGFEVIDSEIFLYFSGVGYPELAFKEWRETLAKRFPEVSPPSIEMIYSDSELDYIGIYSVSSNEVLDESWRISKLYDSLRKSLEEHNPAAERFAEAVGVDIEILCESFICKRDFGACVCHTCAADAGASEG